MPPRRTGPPPFVAAVRSGRAVPLSQEQSATRLLQSAAMRLYALRGAITVERNDAELILAATERLVTEILDRNAIEPAALVSCIFTATEDLDAEFPAVAARRVGLSHVPLLCARELPVPGSLPRVIRALVHYYAEEGHEPQHVYLEEARSLRADLDHAQ